MFKVIVELFQRFVVAYEKDVEHKIASRGRLTATSEKLGAKVEELGEVLKEEVAAPAEKALVAPTDRDVLKKDLEAMDVDFANKAQTTTLQKLWLEAKAKGSAPPAPARTYTAEEVRAKGIERAGAVGKERVQTVFSSVGAAKFTEIPEEKYPGIMAALEALK